MIPDLLRRSSAPLSVRAWAALDGAAAAAARHVLAARRVATFDGPHGWQHVGSRLPRSRPCHGPGAVAAVCIPEVVLLAEISAEFTLPWAVLEAFERGAPTLDTDTAEVAARDVAFGEERVLLYGDPTGAGFLTARESPRRSAGDWADPGRVLADVVAAVRALDAAGVSGPYEALLSADGYYAYQQAAAEGYPVSRQLGSLLARVHRAPALRERGAVFSTRRGDFVVTVGGDLSLGYRHHDSEGVRLVCVETVAGLTHTPQAVCLLLE